MMALGQRGGLTWAPGLVVLVVACSSGHAAVGPREPTVVVVPPAPSAAPAASDDTPPPPSRTDAPAPDPGRETITGGITCQKASACCRRVLAAAGRAPAQLAVCDTFSNQPDATCAPLLDALRTSARQSGLHCD